MPTHISNDRDGDWPRSFLAGPESSEARGSQPGRDEWRITVHLSSSLTMQVAIVERVCYNDSHRAERVGGFVPITMKAEGKRSAGTV